LVSELTLTELISGAVRVNVPLFDCMSAAQFVPGCPVAVTVKVDDPMGAAVVVLMVSVELSVPVEVPVSEVGENDCNVAPVGSPEMLKAAVQAVAPEPLPLKLTPTTYIAVPLGARDAGLCDPTVRLFRDVLSVKVVCA
jgi:hypothetical protein